MSLSTAQEALVEKSRHLRLHSRTDGRKLAYHSLFGNLAWLDDDLYRYLEASSGSASRARLESEIGADAASVLWSSYFFVENPSEERELIDGWLAERESQLQTGYFLGGLQISSSNVCNFACSYCFADASDRRSHVRQEVAAGPQNISFELAAQAIDEVRGIAARHGRDRIAVKFLGREPLVNWRVTHQLLEAYDDGKVQWAMTTNGSLLKPDVAAALARHDVRIMISLDGPPAVNNAFRVWKGVHGGSTYEAIEASLRNLHEVGHPFGVSTVVSRATDFPTMTAFVDRLTEYGVREIELTLAMQVADSRAQDRYPSPRDFATDLVALYEHAQSRGLLVHGDWVDPFHRLLTTHKFRHEPRVDRPLGASCTATEHQISLEPSGDLFPCRAMSLHYGHIGDLASVLGGESYRQVAMRTYYNVPFCRGCELEGHCQGACLGSSEEANGDIYQPQRDYCGVYIASSRLLLERLDGTSLGMERPNV